MLTNEQQKEERDKRSASGEAASDDDAYSDGDCPYLSQDMPNQEHIEREHGIDSHQRIKTFQRMMYGLVAKDIPRKMRGSVEGAQDHTCSLAHFVFWAKVSWPNLKVSSPTLRSAGPTLRSAAQP